MTVARGYTKTGKPVRTYSGYLATVNRNAWNQNTALRGNQLKPMNEINLFDYVFFTCISKVVECK